MFHRQKYFASSLRSSGDKVPNDKPQIQKRAIQEKRKEPKRWQRAMPTNLLKQNIRIPQRQLSDNSENAEHVTGKKRNFMNQLRAMLTKRFLFCQKTNKRFKLHSDSSPKPVILKENAISSKRHLLPRTIKEFSYPKVFPKLKRKHSQNAIHLDVDFVEEHAESIRGTNTLVQARRMTRRISVVSLSPRIQKGYPDFQAVGPLTIVSRKFSCFSSHISKAEPTGIPSAMQLLKTPYSAKKQNFPLFKKESISPEWYHSDLTVGKLQMQVDNLLDNISEKSIQLLALRSAELQQCETLGDKILQSSKQFQRVSSRTTKKHKMKNMCFPCRCCC